MTNAIGRAVAAGMLAALFGAAAVSLFYAWHPALTIEFDRDLPRNVTGIYPPEREEASGLTFAWTAGDTALRLPGLDRHVPWTLDLRIRGGHAADVNPEVTILADGLPLMTRRSASDFEDVRVVIPARPERPGLVVGLHTSATFVPGPSDPRPLGVMLDRLALRPDGIVLVPRPALGAATVSSAAMGAAIALLGVTAGSAIGGSILLGTGAASILARGFGPFTDYPGTAIRLGVWIALVLGVAAIAVQRGRRTPLRNTARFAAAFSASALFLKLLVLLHPNMPVGDAMFHAHRFQGVLGGHLYFTSVAPGGYSFPYPPGLYLVASIFASLVRRGASDMALLRIIACSADAAAGLLLYTIVVRGWGTRLAAAMAVAIYHLIPLDFAVLTTGNLTNAFAQSVAVGGLALMADDAVRLERWSATALLAVVLAVAYLSHTGTLAILFVATLATVALFWLHGGPALRSAAAAITIATMAAAVLAVVLYYAHFMDTYRAEFARIGHETATAASDAGGRTIGDRFKAVPYNVSAYIGAPVMLFALLGAVELSRRRAHDRLILTLAGWALSCVAFLALGILTPVDMRYYLAAVPVIAIAAAYGAAWAWKEGWPLHRTLWRVTAAVFLVATISMGFHNWWHALG